MVTAVEPRHEPQNIEAEQSVLGSLLIDRDAIIKVATFLKAEDFALTIHGQVYQAILDLYNRREPTDLLTLTDELTRRQQLEGIGGLAYLSELVNAVPTAVHVEFYGKIVERTATLRRLIRAGTAIVQIGYESNIEAEVALDQAEKLIFQVSEKRGTKDFQHIQEVLERFFDQIDYLQQHRGDVVGVATGFSDLDQLTGGLQRSDLIIIAARPSVGKTAFALGLAHGAAVQNGKTVGIFSLEMSAEQLVQRLLATETGVDSHRLRLGQIDDSEWDRVSRAFGRLAEANIYIDDTASIGVMELRSKARRLQAEQGLDLVVVDYLQLMTGRRTENRVQEISEISRSLKGLARELNVPVIALSQLSRAVETRSDHRPMLSDLRESGCLAGETPVYLPDEGVYRPIRELVGRIGFNVLALNPATWRLEPRPVLAAFPTGRKPVYRLRTGLGRQIRATGNHRFLTIEGWRRLDELSPGTRIAAPSQTCAQMASGGLPRQATHRVMHRATHRAAHQASSLLLIIGNPFGAETALASRPSVVVLGLEEASVNEHQASSLVPRPNWDEIAAIEADGAEDVFDLTVDELHNFVAGDIIVHNSIEQDADIVMFIYRDEVYDPDTEKKGIAEIIVAKHRNGPVGTINLRFFSQTARFADLELYRDGGL